MPRYNFVNLYQVLNILTDEAILAKTAHLSEEKLQGVFHRVCAMSNRDTVSEILKMGVNPCWRDGYGISCIDKALINHNGNNVDRQY